MPTTTASTSHSSRTFLTSLAAWSLFFRSTARSGVTKSLCALYAKPMRFKPKSIAMYFITCPNRSCQTSYQASHHFQKVWLLKPSLLPPHLNETRISQALGLEEETALHQ